MFSPEQILSGKTHCTIRTGTGCSMWTTWPWRGRRRRRSGGTASSRSGTSPSRRWSWSCWVAANRWQKRQPWRSACGSCVDSGLVPVNLWVRIRSKIVQCHDEKSWRILGSVFLVGQSLIKLDFIAFLNSKSLFYFFYQNHAPKIMFHPLWWAKWVFKPTNKNRILLFLSTFIKKTSLWSIVELIFFKLKFPHKHVRSYNPPPPLRA